MHRSQPDVQDAHAPEAPASARTTETAARPVACTVHRRPVVTVAGHVVGYAVTATLDLGGIPTQRSATSPEEVAAAREDLHQAYMTLDWPNLVADRFVFVPATPQMLEGFLPTPVVPGRMVLTLPVGFEHTADALDRVAALKGLGMQLALDDYTGTAAQEGLLPHVAFVVVRAGSAPLAPLVHHVHRAGARVLATDVHSATAEDECRAAGVDAVIGSQAERAATATLPRPGATSSDATSSDPLPSGVPAAGAAAAPSSAAPAAQAPGEAPAPQPRAQVLRAGQSQCMAIMHLLHDPDVSFSQVSQVIDTDPVLTLRTLHLVNSGAFALAQPVDTVAQAIVLLGRRELETLVTALLVDARPDAMDSLWLILARALTCEALTEDSAAYTVGMLSGLSEQLGLPAAVVVEKVGVSSSVAAAVVDAAGPYGDVLAAVRGHERADVSAVLTAGMDPREVSDVYMQAVSDALATARTVTRAV